MDSPLVITRARRVTLALGVPLTLAAIVLVALNLLAWVSPTSTTINTSAPIRGTSLAISADEGNLTLVPSTDNRVHVEWDRLLQLRRSPAALVHLRIRNRARPHVCPASRLLLAARQDRRAPRGEGYRRGSLRVHQGQRAPRGGRSQHQRR